MQAGREIEGTEYAEVNGPEKQARMLTEQCHGDSRDLRIEITQAGGP